MKFNFDAPDCTCPYKDGSPSMNICRHADHCPVFKRWEVRLSEMIAELMPTGARGRVPVTVPLTQADYDALPNTTKLS